jgi:hypothetical protein
MRHIYEYPGLTTKTRGQNTGGGCFTLHVRVRYITRNQEQKFEHCCTLTVYCILFKYIISPW